MKDEPEKVVPLKDLKGPVDVDTWVPSSPINSKGDRVLVRGVPEGLQRLIQQRKATGVAQKRERIVSHLEKIDGLLEVLSEDQREQLIHVIHHVSHESARNYVDDVILTHLPKVLKHIPTDYAFPDPLEQPMVVNIPGAPATPDPLIAETPETAK